MNFVFLVQFNYENIPAFSWTFYRFVSTPRPTPGIVSLLVVPGRCDAMRHKFHIPNTDHINHQHFHGIIKGKQTQPDKKKDGK